MYDYDYLKSQFAKFVSQEVFETLAIIPTAPGSDRGARTTDELKDILDELEEQAAKHLRVNL